MLPNPLIPFDAEKFFAQKGKWELLNSEGDTVRADSDVAINLTTGNLTYFKTPMMRLKPIKQQKWINLYHWGISLGYPSQAVADQNKAANRIECRLIEWDV